MAGLSRKHQVFAAAYAACWNATEAATQAGYSRRRAKQTGNDLLRRPDIREAVNAAVAARLGELCITQQRMLLELAGVAFTRLNQVAEWGPDGVSLLDSSTLTPAEASSVASVGEVLGKDGAKAQRIKQHDKLQALGMMIQLLGLDPEKALKLQLAPGGAGSGEVILRWQDERADADLQQLQKRWSEDEET